jgi:hypothetical protein
MSTPPARPRDRGDAERIVDQRAQLLVLLLRLGHGAADDRLDAREDADLVRPAAVLLHARVDAVAEGAALGMVSCAVKIMSAVRAARSMPTSDEPACAITGRPCGERATLSGPRTLKYSPL